MILDRFYTPQQSDLIFHYCRPATFLEIVKSKSMWFSDLYSMNDFMEMRWGYSIFEKAASALLKKGISRKFLDKVDKQVSGAYGNVVLLASCYSLDADVLSQWRAYTDDGRGFAVGFLAREMVEMPVKPLQVLYDEDKQVEEMVGNLRHTYEHEKSIGFRYDKEFESHWIQAALDLCAYKNPAFGEEKEIRLVYAAGLASEGNSKKIAAMPGTAWGRSFSQTMFSFELPVR